MATWVEDIIQALKNLGGQATLNQIYEEVARIREGSLHSNYKASIRERIEAHSSDSRNFQGKDYFQKITKGVWALRDYEKRDQISQVISANIDNNFQDYSPSDSPKANIEETTMENNGLIQDTGLFVGQKLFEFSLTESFESITNLLQTIKEYREFANPVDADWFEYVHQIFNIFGFGTTKVAPRLITLHEMSAIGEPKALVCIVGPQEDFDQIIYGLTWESYLYYAAKHYHVEWVILTNGLQFKVLNYGDNADDKKYFKCEFDEIIKHGKTDSFLTLYKIFSVINRVKGGDDDKQKAGGKPKEKGKRIIVERHHVRMEFWQQLLARSKSKTKLFDKKSPGIESYLGIGAGKSGISYLYTISNESARIELYIDKGNKDWNKRAFDSLVIHKQEIENIFGSPLAWERLDNNKASIIRHSLTQSGLQDRDKWLEIQDMMIEAMIRFDQAFRPFIQQIP